MQTVFWWEKRNRGMFRWGRWVSVWEAGIEFQFCCWVPFVWLSLLHEKCVCAGSRLGFAAEGWYWWILVSAVGINAAVVDRPKQLLIMVGSKISAFDTFFFHASAVVNVKFHFSPWGWNSYHVIAYSSVPLRSVLLRRVVLKIGKSSGEYSQTSFIWVSCLPLCL